MLGTVTADGREPVLALAVLDADGRRVVVETVVDTGFDGELQLPSESVR